MMSLGQQQEKREQRIWLETQVQGRYFYYFLEFTSQAHLPIVRSSTNPTSQTLSGLLGENYNSQNALHPGGLP